ncbi:MDR family MFS transporter [Paenibacillus abyssi]|uniref:MFS transporter n=1 Tax=Paenibacillus abyssi TaxID=1340531 RepID=A0A917G2H2_9BACL|nr:MDR family MFS transporter [Paenibacillus abyssi]GGG19636.1 MFS transporter [Paenibacillus abyssi]
MENLDHRKKITIMVAVMAALLFAALNQTIISTALPTIIERLGGMEYYSWVFTVYMLTSSITTILVGKLSDIYGRKPFILVGIGVFVVGSLLCGLSENIMQLIVYRGIQGLGGGMIMSTAFTAVGDLFAPRERGRWQGLMTGVFGLASVFGPTLGGYIVDHTEWHWVFWVFLPFGIIAFVMIWMMFPKVERKRGESIDYLGSLFLTLTMVPLLLAFSWAGTTYAWGSVQIIGLLSGALAALILFIISELKVKSPVVPLHLFKNSVYSISNLVSFLLGAGMFGAIMYMPWFIQGVLGTSATLSGYVVMPMTLSLVLGSAIGGQMMTRTGKYKTLALIGIVIMGIGMLMLSRMDTSTTTLTAIINMIVTGLGLGLAMPVFTLTVQNSVEDKMLGVATASSQLFRSLGGTIGVSVMSTIMVHRLSSRMMETSAGMQRNGPVQIPEEAAAAFNLLKDPQALLDSQKLAAAAESLPAELRTMFDQAVLLLREALGYSLSGVFISGAAVIGLAFICTIFIKEIPLRSAMKKDGSEEVSGSASKGKPARQN